MRISTNRYLVTKSIIAKCAISITIIDTCILIIESPALDKV